MSADDPREFADFDHHAPDHRVGAECVWARMRALPQLPRSERHGGFHVVTRHADLTYAAANPAIFSSAQGIALPAEDRTRHIPAETDPPAQREYRALLNPFLGPKEVAQMESAVRRHARTLLDGLAGTAAIEFVEGFAKPFPVMVALEVFGFPLADAAMLDRTIMRVIDGRGSDDGRNAARELSDYIEATLRRHAAVAREPSEGILSAIVLGRIAGRPLSLDEQISITRLLLFGGFTTTQIALSSTLHWLAQNPAAVARLRAEPALWPTAVEEFLRWSSPAVYLARTVVQGAELGGSALHAGERVLLCFAAANRDPAKFTDPETVDLGRTPNPHVAFGHGVHRCMGSLVAKLELRVALEEWFARYESFTLDGSRPLAWASGETQGLTCLPLRVQPR